MAYSDQEKNKIFEKICLEMEKGRSLRSILKEDDNMPSTSTFYIWLTEDPIKSKRYELAADLRTDILFDEIVDIAYNIEIGTTTKETERGVEVTTGDMLGHRRLKIDALKWSLSKLNPKKYGDKIDVTTKDESINKPVDTNEVLRNIKHVLDGGNIPEEGS